MADDKEIVANVRRLSGVGSDRGPGDDRILAAVKGFVEAFDYWYIRVMREAVPQYRNLIVKRINPFIRRMEFDGMEVVGTANRLVEDYNNRNFVTAGGWALEEMAATISVNVQKSGTAGIDLQRFDPNTSDYHLYILKSGLVTRNSDIVGALKKHSRLAEKVLLQGRSTGKVHLNWAVVAGKTSSTFEDGIRRPSSAEFWSEMTGLPQETAIEVVLGVAAEAGRLVRKDANAHLTALKHLVADYISVRDGSGQVDWDFIARRNMSPPEGWRTQDLERHKRALGALAASGYTFDEAQSQVAHVEEEPERGGVAKTTGAKKATAKKHSGPKKKP